MVTSNDEIGLLAKSINNISDKLKVSIEALKGDIEFQKGLARNISHELKTPIGVIKGYAEGLLFGVADNKEMKDNYCRVIVDECDRMDSLVKELLDLSALESGNSTVKRDSIFDLSALIESVTKRLTPIFIEEGITCHTECDDGIELEGDFELLERALTNIVMNGVKYNNENRYIKLVARTVDDVVLISVYNTGEAIPHEELSKIWDVFYKVDKSRQRKFGGHGLGLSIVKSIILLHKGEVTAKNSIGGVEFILKLPLKK